MVRDSTEQHIVFVENYGRRYVMINMKNAVIWGVTPYSLIEVYLSFK
jgi:hypothetical protein